MSLVEGSPPTTPATATEDEHFVYEQDVEVETSLDTELPLDDDTDNTVAVDHAVIVFYSFLCVCKSSNVWLNASITDDVMTIVDDASAVVACYHYSRYSR